MGAVSWIKLEVPIKPSVWGIAGISPSDESGGDSQTKYPTFYILCNLTLYIKSTATKISLDELQIVYFQLYIAVSMYKHEKSHARAKEAVPSLSDPLGFVCFVWYSQSIGILKFKNGLEITNQTHVLFGKLLISAPHVLMQVYVIVSYLEIIELLQLNSVRIYLILYKI